MPASCFGVSGLPSEATRRGLRRAGVSGELGTMREIFFLFARDFLITLGLNLLEAVRARGDSEMSTDREWERNEVRLCNRVRISANMAEA